MKLKRLFIIAAFTFLSSSCWRGAGEAPLQPHYLPSVMSDFSDLDVRDAQNRPLTTAQAIGELVVLFRENAVEMAVRATPPSLQCLTSLIDAFSHLFKDAFFTVSRMAPKQIQTALFMGIRRVVHNVHNLWITSSDGTSIGKVSGALLTLSRKPQKLYLRC